MTAPETPVGLKSLGPVGAAALIAGTLAVVITVVSLAGPVDAAFVPTPSPTAAAGREKELADGYAKAIEEHTAQLDGRSPFFVPSAPPPPPPPPPPPVEYTEPPPPPPPATYGGPALIGMINDVAWFADNKKLKPGESDGDLKIIRLDPPWGATVLWKDVEFKISLFSRDSVVAPAPKAEPAPSVPPAAEPEPPAAAPPAETPPTETPPPSDPPAPSEGPP